jgi:hypothetical protein
MTALLHHAPAGRPLFVAVRPTTGFDHLFKERRPASRRQPQAVAVHDVHRPIRVKMASEANEWQQAYEILAATYQARGYEAPSAKLIRFTPYHALPDTATFVAKLGEEVLATLSVVVDNTLLGLPTEAVFPDEVADLRRSGRRLSEATSLADRGLGMREFIPVFVTLIRLAMQYAVKQGSDTWLITVNPRHRGFYTKVLGFVPLGRGRTCPSVQDAPAEAYMLDDALMSAGAPRMREQVFGQDLSEAVLPEPAMPARLVRHFGGQSTQTDRRTIDQLLRFIEQLGNPRRW